MLEPPRGRCQIDDNEYIYVRTYVYTYVCMYLAASTTVSVLPEDVGIIPLCYPTSAAPFYVRLHTIAYVVVEALQLA